MSDATENKPKGLAWIVLAGVVLWAAPIGFLWSKMEQQRKDLSAEISALHESTAGEISSVRRTTTASSATSRETEDALRQQLDAARKQAAAAAGKARTEAVQHAEELAQRLAEEQQKQQQAVAGELTGLKDATSAVDAKATEISGEVKSVKSELDNTTAELKSVKGDLGVQSGLVATNAKELATLKALGERGYFEFNLARTKEPQMVGNIKLALQKADPKRNRYTVTVLADDKKIEKRDKTVNEPVQFYLLGMRQPCEIVVNEVHKDRVVGYLAMPKAREVASR
jgi:chromosome segregation ATPase